MSVKSLQLVWDEHLKSIGKLFEKLYEDEQMVDVTISCRDGNIRAHKIVLSAASPYFQNVLNENPCKHPTLIMRGTSFLDMQKLIQYMYRGTIDVSVERVNAIIQLALDLDVKGFEKFHLDVGSANQIDITNNYARSQDIDPNVPKVTHSIDTRFKGLKRVVVNHLDDSSAQPPKMPNGTANLSSIVISDVRGGVASESNGNNLATSDQTDNTNPTSHADSNPSSSSYPLMLSKAEEYMKRNKDVPECEICFRRYKSKKDLHRHMKAHTKQFRCDFCRKCFSRASHLVRHRRVHTGERPFICNLCGKDFARQDKLKLHKRSSHPDANFSSEMQSIEFESSYETTELGDLKDDDDDDDMSDLVEKRFEEEFVEESSGAQKEIRPELGTQMKRGRGRPRKYPLQIPIIVLPKRGRGRPRKNPEEGHSGDAQQKSNYDFSSLPYGDLNYLTMPLEEEMPIEPLVEINTDSTAEINTDSAARINTDSTAETNTDSTTGNNTNSSQNNSEPALQTQVLTTNEVPSNNQIVTNNVEIKQKEVIDCA